MTTSTPIADVLRNLDSHDIYDAAELERQLRDAGYSGPVPSYTPKQVAGQIAARGLGGNLEPGFAEKLVAGFQLARAVAAYYGVAASGDQFNGRGSAFRAYIASIAAFEDVRAPH